MPMSAIIELTDRGENDLYLLFRVFKGERPFSVVDRPPTPGKARNRSSV